jgi:hypothetical protein
MEIINLESTALIESLGLILASLAVCLCVLMPFKPFKAKRSENNAKLASKKA